MLQRIVVLPGDVQTAGKPHDVGGAVGAALLAGGFVLRRIPGIADAPAFGVQRQRVVDTLSSA